MRMANRLVLIVVTAVLVSAQGISGGLTVTLSNGTTNNVLVTAYDLNATSRQRILSGELINGNASIPVSLSADASGRGHLAWTAITADRDMGGCGHGDNARLNDGDTVNVNADSTCPGQ
jgi:hypothetical protein